jgi:L-amino acid N-acyltransferase YncA
MDFSQAILEDVDNILQINQKYLRKNLLDDSRGFLLGERTKEFVSSNLRNYYVAKEKNNILGYAEISYSIGDDNFATGTWVSTDQRDYVLGKIQSKEFIYLIQLASETQKKGIGVYIVENLSKLFKNSIIISFVAYKPYFNEVSMHFHEKVFQKVGDFTMESKFGIDGYKRICYIKK